MTRIAIVGSREFGNVSLTDASKSSEAWDFLIRVFNGLDKKFGTWTLVSGGAIGADRMAEWTANKRGIPVQIYCLHNRWSERTISLPDGTKYLKHELTVCDKAGHVAQDYGWENLVIDKIVTNKDAGYKRNVVIVENSDVVVAFLHPASRGTRHTVHLALEQGKTVHLFDAFTYERLKSCPCDDDETHTRLTQTKPWIYNTVLMQGREVSLAPEQPRLHMYEQAEADATSLNDSDYALLYDQTCQTCGREMPEGNCEKCAGEVYGVLERPEPSETPADHPDITGHNYFVKPPYVPVMRDPHIGANEKILVNGYWVYTRQMGREVYASPAALRSAIAHFRAKPQGDATMPAPAAIKIAADFDKIAHTFEVDEHSTVVLDSIKYEPLPNFQPPAQPTAEAVALAAAIARPAYTPPAMTGSFVLGRETIKGDMSPIQWSNA